MPHVVRYLNAFLQSLAPAGQWCALAISANVATELHRDLKNEPTSENIAVSLGQDSGGGIWIAASDGDCKRTLPSNGSVMRGRVHDSQMCAVSFSPGTWHASSDWTGFRWVITGYTLEGAAVAVRHRSVRSCLSWVSL